jgi:hypothetical protein
MFQVHVAVAQSRHGRPVAPKQHRRHHAPDGRGHGNDGDKQRQRKRRITSIDESKFGFMADKISSGMAGSDGDSNPTSLSRGDAGCKSAKRRSANSARCCQCCTEKLLPDIAMQSKCFCDRTAFNTSGRGSLVNRSQTGQGKPQDSRGGMPWLLSALTATARVRGAGVSHTSCFKLLGAGNENVVKLAP